MRAEHQAEPLGRSSPPWVGTSIAGLLASVTAAVATSVVLATRHDPASVSMPEARVPTVVVLLFATALAVGAVACLAGAASARLVAPGLAVAVIAASLAFLSEWAALPIGARAALVAATVLTGAGIVHAATASRGSLGAASRAAYLLAGAALVLRITLYNPFADPSCWRICRDTPRLPSPWPASTVYDVSSLLAVAACLIGVAALAARPRRLDLFGAVGALALLALVVSSVLELNTATDQRWAVSPMTWAPVAVGAVGGAVLVRAWRTLSTSRQVARLLSQLRDPEAGMVSGTIQPDVHFRDLDSPDWVDAHGEPAPSEAPGATVLCESGGRATIRAVLATAPHRGQGISQALTPARRLSLENARLTALAQAHVRKVREAQRRIVQRADRERHRIERDLHDGAQQHLVGASLQLSIAAGSGARSIVPALEAVQAQLGRCLDEIRRISHGPLPVLLADDGLEAALDELTRTTDLPARLVWSQGTVVPSDASHAIYLAVAALLDQVTAATPSASVTITVGCCEEKLVATLVLAGVAADVRVEVPAVALDRIGALAGSATVDLTDCITVRIQLPCGS